MVISWEDNMKNTISEKIRRIYEKYPKTIKVIIGIVIFISAPLIIDYCIIGNNFPSNIDNSDWVSFWGSYIGAFATLIGIWWTIKFTREQAIKDREFAREQAIKDREYAREQALEERSYQCEPKLILHTKNKYPVEIESECQNISLYYKVMNTHNTNVNVYYVMKNIGLGPAIDIKFTNIKYRNVNLNNSFGISGLDIGQEILVKLEINMYLNRILEIDHIYKTSKEPLEKWDSQLDRTGGQLRSRSEVSHPESGCLEFDIEYCDLFGDSYYYSINVKTHISILCWYIEEKNQWMFADTSLSKQVNSRTKIYRQEIQHLGN